MQNQSLANRPKSAETSKRRESLIRSCISTLATGLGVEVTKERAVLYLHPLESLSDAQIKRAFAAALRSYQPFGGSFPSPAELIAYAEQDAERRYNAAATAEILARRGKPPDWVPLTASELQAIRPQEPEV